MQTNRMLTMMIAGAILIAVIVVGVIVIISRSSGPSGQDAALQTTLQAIKTELNKKGTLPVNGPTLQSFQAWVYDTRSLFLKSVHHETAHQFAQVVLTDPNTMPLQTLGLHQSAHQVLGIPPSAINQAFKSPGPQCGDTQDNGQNLRFCTIALTTPSALRSSNASALLTVLAPK